MHELKNKIMKKIYLIFSLLFLATTCSLANSHQINAGGFYYQPSSLTVSIGDTVVWINDGGTHDVNGNINSQTGSSFNNPESFSSASISAQGAIIYTHVFTVPGTYNYDCSVGNHAAMGMVGTIIVEDETTVFDLIASSENHSTLETALLTAGLDAALNGDGPFTVFAPSDDAFGEIPQDDLNNLLANAAQLNAVLLHHVHAGEILAQDIVTMNGMTIETLNQDQLLVTINGSTVMIDMSTVTTPDLIADNGVVHVVDMVLMPETLTTVFDIIAGSENHMTLETAILEAELDDALNGVGPLTVFAPSDDVFDNLPEGTLATLLANTNLLTTILLHHVHAGELLSADLVGMDGMTIETLNDDELTITIANDIVKIDMATVTIPDLTAINGVVHVIDMVLMPEIDTTITVMDIVDNSPSHTTLKTALYEAELDDDLRTEGPFTVFAPTDSAFNSLPAGTLDDLLDNIPALIEVLHHHVHSGNAMAEDLSNDMMIPTLNNDNLTVTIEGSTVMIDMATVVLADLTADNGVVHVVDMVLLPESNPTVIDEFISTDKFYLYTMNILGEKVDRNAKDKILIDIFSDGSSIKRYNLTK